MANISEPLFVNMPDDDPSLLASVAEAKEKLPQFKAAYFAGKFKTAAYLVKVPFIDRSDVGLASLIATSEVVAENPKKPVPRLWLAVTSILDDLIFCCVGEAPKQLGLSRGDSFVIEEKIVEDWVITDRDVGYGGFSLVVLRKRLGEADRRRFDEYSRIREFKDLP